MPVQKTPIWLASQDGPSALHVHSPGQRGADDWAGGRIGGHIMPRVQLPAVTSKRKVWNKGRIIGQKRPLLPKQVWAIRARLELSGNLRDLTLFNVAIDSKLRSCDLVKLTVTDLVKDDRVWERVFCDPEQNQTACSIRTVGKHA